MNPRERMEKGKTGTRQLEKKWQDCKSILNYIDKLQ